MIKTKRWCDPAEPDDGFRVLVARFRPRGVSRSEETWTGFMPQLGPSKELHAAFYGKGGETLTFEQYATRYLEEMQGQALWIRGLAEHVRAGRALTLLCSSACIDESRCHRTLLKGLIEAELSAPNTQSDLRPAVRRKRAPGQTE